MIDLASVIAQVESGTQDDRLRFEPGLYADWGGPLSTARRNVVAAIGVAHKCSADTAVMIATTSWGRYQILGENIYSVCQYKGSVFAFVAFSDHQQTCFSDFLAARGIAFTLTDLVMDRTKREQFITHYNGPANIDAYWQRMQAAIKALGGPVVVGEGVST